MMEPPRLEFQKFIAASEQVLALAAAGVALNKEEQNILLHYCGELTKVCGEKEIPHG